MHRAIPMPVTVEQLKHQTSTERTMNSSFAAPSSRRAAQSPATSQSKPSSVKRKPLSRAFKALFSAPNGSWDFPDPVFPSAPAKKSTSALLAQARRVVKRVRQKLNSKTPKEQLPTTWEDWNKRYANYEIDLNDPPMPPAVQADDKDPYNSRVYPAPHPTDEAERQAVVAKLDLFGTRNKAAAASESSLELSFSHSRTARPTTSSGASMMSVGGASVATSTNEANSLENHPPFRAIVAQIRELFDAQVGMITVIDDEQQLFLATGGMPEGVDSLPRSVTFCSHAILADEVDKGMVILDSTKDWRFANNVPTAALGARFYAGVPLLAPTFGDPNAPAVAIGTICAVDVKPREQFDDASRAKLRELAEQATKEIEAWVTTRMAGKLERLESLYQQTLHITDSRTSGVEPTAQSAVQREAVTTPPADEPTVSEPRSKAEQKKEYRFPLPSPPLVSLPPTPPESVLSSTHGRSGSTVSSVSMASMASTSSSISQASLTSQASQASQLSDVSLPSQPVIPRRKLAALPVTEQSPVPSCSAAHQKLLDASCRMLARSLNLNLVYVASIDFNSSPANGKDDVGSLRILSSHGLPTPAPAFDSALHVRALRSPEGGLLYRNPTENSRGYASGILISVIEARRVGFVIGGFTEDRTMQIGEKERILFVRFAEKLEDTCLALLRNRV